jgi:hypothetical protein
MIERTLKIFSIFLLVLFLITVNKIPAQEFADHLVITQVCLNDSQTGKSWVEVFNPTNKPLILERFRISHLKSINVLPNEINKEGGIKVGAGEHVILCADENLFKSFYGDRVKAVNVKALSRITSGGFLALWTKGAGEAKGAVVRYGKEEFSSKIAKLAGDQVVGFSEEGKSYKRKIEKKGTEIIIMDFTESAADPGK